MTQDKLVLEKCCFCIPKRYGLLTYGYVILIFHLLHFAGGIAELFIVREWDFFNVAYTIVNIMNIVFSSFLIYGGHKKTPKWLVLFFWYQIAVILFNLSFDLVFFYIEDFFKHPEFVVIYLLFVYGVLSPFVIYLLILVRSNYMKMQRNYPVAYTAQTDF